MEDSATNMTFSGTASPVSVCVGGGGGEGHSHVHTTQTMTIFIKALWMDALKLDKLSTIATPDWTVEK